MAQNREYQYDFSEINPAMHNREGRKKKAITMVAVFHDFFDDPLQNLRAIDVGASTGIIDAHLAEYFGSMTGIDIDSKAVDLARKSFERSNLFFHEGDAMNLKLPDESVEVVVCSQVYEHVPDAEKMMQEIFRVLRPGGICYFAASNRIMWNEPHYNLPLLSVIPRPLAHLYVRLSGKADHYHELHFSYWRLTKLVRSFEIVDYTLEVVANPGKYGVSYMLPPGSIKALVAKLVTKYMYWFVPGYVWVLRKPGKLVVQENVSSDIWQG